jgi:hypothetical protein
MEHPTPNNNFILEFLETLLGFIFKNLLGIASVIFGVTTKIYMIKRQAKRVKPSQCYTAVFVAGIAGSIAWYIVNDAGLPEYQQAVICGFTPIIIEPVSLRVVIWVDPIVDAIGAAIKRFFTKQNK